MEDSKNESDREEQMVIFDINRTSRFSDHPFKTVICKNQNVMQNGDTKSIGTLFYY